MQALLQQQSTFESSINSLIANIHNISAKVNATSNITSKITILEHAITTERQKIAQLQSHIIPPFNLSRTSCLQLTPSQKLNLLTETNKAKIELSKLLQMVNSMPVNAETSQLKIDISQQETIVHGIDSVLHSQCNNASILGPTVFQTNLYASNWILGRQTINNLINQYY